MPTPTWQEEFEKQFKCINAESLGCDSKGNIPVQTGEGEWEAEQCQYCFERLFKYKDFIIQLLAAERKALIAKVRGEVDKIERNNHLMRGENIKHEKEELWCCLDCYDDSKAKEAFNTVLKLPSLTQE